MCAQDQRKDIRIKSSNFAKKDNLHTIYVLELKMFTFQFYSTKLEFKAPQYAFFRYAFKLCPSKLGVILCSGDMWPHQKKSFECGKCKNLFSPKYYVELMKKVKSDMYIRLSPIINEAAILMLSQKYLHNIMILRFFSNFPVSNVHFI